MTSSGNRLSQKTRFGDGLLREKHIPLLEGKRQASDGQTVTGVVTETAMDWGLLPIRSHPGSRSREKKGSPSGEGRGNSRGGKGGVGGWTFASATTKKRRGRKGLTRVGGCRSHPRNPKCAGSRHVRCGQKKCSGKT